MNSPLVPPTEKFKIFNAIPIEKFGLRLQDPQIKPFPYLLCARSYEEASAEYGISATEFNEQLKQFTDWSESLYRNFPNSVVIQLGDYQNKILPSQHYFMQSATEVNGAFGFPYRVRIPINQSLPQIEYKFSFVGSSATHKLRKRLKEWSQNLNRNFTIRQTPPL